MANTEITFKKYNSREDIIDNPEVDEATFSVIRTTGCNVNDNNGDGSIKDLYLNETKMTDVYNSRKVGENVKTTCTVGGIPAGTKLTDLTNMSLGEVIDKMLFKSYPPEYKKPYLNISGDNGLLRVGKTYTGITTYSANRGIYTKYNNNLPYTGEPEPNTLTGTNLESGVMGENDIVRVASIYFSDGQTPVDSDGNPYDNGSDMPFRRNMVESNSLTLIPYYNWYATGKYVSGESQSKIDYTKKMPLTELKPVARMGIKKIEVMLDMSAGDSANPQKIEVPNEIIDCMTFAEGEWKPYSFGDWYNHTTGRTEDGRTYHLYTMKPEAYVDGSVGGTRLKFTVTGN